MGDVRTKRSLKAGLPPGTPIHIGARKAESMTIFLLRYDESSCEETTISQIEKPLELHEKRGTTWVAVRGIQHIEGLQSVAKVFGLHPLVVEDIVNTEQRPKIEDYGSYLFIVLKMLHEGRETWDLNADQVSLILGEDFVLSFEEGTSDVFEKVRERLRNGKGRLRSQGSDYLAYTLIDTIVDHYFPVLERLGEEIEKFEDELITNPGTQSLPTLHQMKRAMIVVRKSVWPVREVVGHLERGQSALVKQSTLVYLRDVYDHTIQVIEATETFRDMLAGMMDIYLSSLSYRLNETMKLLAVIATLFIPLTFIAGVYGMNFRYMPELEWRWGYPAVLVVMVGLAGYLLWYFKRKRWF